MRKTHELFRIFISDETGMETVEWAILAALIVAGLVAVIATLGSNILAKFTTLKDGTT
jgi:Flp pilus assembly pilin Flp